MSKNNKIIGKTGEEIAVNYYKNSGAVIHFKNYKCRYGEIDIIAGSGRDLIFAEVKTRENINYGYPFEAVTESKLNKIKKASQYFLLNENSFEKHNYNLRFDVISIILSKELAVAILAEEDLDPIDINKLRNGIDYNLKHIFAI